MCHTWQTRAQYRSFDIPSSLLLNFTLQDVGERFSIYVPILMLRNRIRRMRLLYRLGYGLAIFRKLEPMLALLITSNARPSSSP